MLRRFGSRRGELSQPVAVLAAEAGEAAAPSERPSEATVQPESTTAAGARRGRIGWRRGLLLALAVLIGMGGVGYSQKDKVTPKAADLSRRMIGDERTARIEGWFFKVEDRVDRVKYDLLGGREDPFATPPVQVQFVAKAAGREYAYFTGSASPAAQSLTAEALGPLPLTPPQTTLLLSDSQPGEGVWTTMGLPRSTPNDMLMAKTFVRPDRTRPYASVGVLLVDSRRVRLKIVGGTAEPGGDRGVRGPGTIPQEDYKSLLVAFNGGFKGPHGSYGMVANGKEYMRMRNGLATICVSKNGSIKIGEYGRDFTWEDGFEACRQNVILMVDKGEISRRTTEGNDTWGYVNVNSAEFITWRSAVGVTKDGNLLIAAGNSLSADTLAKAMHAAGAYYAMQLDINAPYICAGLFFPQPDGNLKSEKFMDSMAPSASNFLGTRERDFLYLTLDEHAYK